MGMPQKYKAIIRDKIKLTDKVYLLNIEILEPKTLEFKAGQFIMWQMDEALKRAYSIASAPSLALSDSGKNGILELFIDITPGGPASKYFINVENGTEFCFTGPYGIFGLKDTPNDIVFIAGSTGIAPFRSMIFDYYENKESGIKNQELREKKVYLFFGVHGVDDRFLVEEFMELEKKESFFKFYSVVSELVNKPGEHGSIAKVMFGAFKEFGGVGGKDFYLCGAPDLVASTRALLLEKGVEAKNIYNEKY